MKINLAKSAGFCFGVNRAIDIALKTASGKKNVYMLGDIVHNEKVVKRIQEAGIKKISKLSGNINRTLLIRAHGASLATMQQAKSLGYKIIDATCPMVKEIHKIARNAEKKGFRLIVIGDKEHDEVLGIIGQLNTEGIVIDKIDTKILAKLKGIKKACIVVQSTQNIERVLNIVAALKKRIPEVKFYNTVCRPTRIKQEEIKTMPLNNDVMIIIGSRKSANTKRLFEISRSLNNKSYWVNSQKEINPEWFRGALTVGVTAGASTPESTIKEIISYLKTRRSL